MPLPAQRRDAEPPSVPAARVARVPAPMALGAFNALPAAEAEEALLRCCGSGRWAQRLAAHRPYPDTEVLLAAAEEASYDLTPDDLAQALAEESAHPPSLGLPVDGGEAAAWERHGVLAAHTALRAAQAAYERRFGHTFLICLDGVRPADRLDQTLAGVRARLGHEPEEERAVAADELRRLAQGRLARLVR